MLAGCVRAGLVLMDVVAQVPGMVTLFVLAIGTRRGPGHLQRKHQQQQDQHEFFHQEGILIDSRSNGQMALAHSQPDLIIFPICIAVNRKTDE